MLRRALPVVLAALVIAPALRADPCGHAGQARRAGSRTGLLPGAPRLAEEEA